MAGDSRMSGRWIVPGCISSFRYDCEFQEIDERRVARDGEQ